MKTFSDFKRDAASGTMSLELLERFGSTGDDIPERLRGVRKVCGVNTVSIKLLNSHGEKSELRLENAKLTEYDGETLTIYKAALRAPTPEEQAVLDGAKKVRDEYQARNPCGDDFWALRRYFKESACPWMDGSISESIKGKRYVYHEQKVMDKSMRGEVILRYRVHKVA